MKTKDLVARLQKLDPSGETEVFCPNGDIHFLESLEWYWDGKPNILIRDNSNLYYNILGMRQINANDKNKIYIHCLSLEDVVDNDWQKFDKLILQGDESFINKAKKYREDAEKMYFEMMIQVFIEYINKRFNLYGDIVISFFNQYKTQLCRNDFNSFGSSIRDKEDKYWDNCVNFIDNKLTYISGFENKNYNPLKHA